MNDIILQAKEISFAYEDGTIALDGISLTIPRGKKIALMGANGSGKSTFFLCLNGIHRPQKGQIYFNGKPIDYSRKGLLDLRSKVGIVFQDPDNQLFSASVYQEISFGPLNLGIAEEMVKNAVENVIQTLEITPFRDRPTHALSGGQKKSVSIADILVMNPEIILFDEPAASLDPKHTKLVTQMIDQLVEHGITIIISTHDPDYALRFADIVILFHNGKVLLEGSPEQVFQNQTALNTTNLEQPIILQLFHKLCQHGILDSTLAIPHDKKALEDYIEHR